MRHILFVLVMLSSVCAAHNATAGMRARILDNVGPQADDRDHINDPRRRYEAEELEERRLEREKEQSSDEDKLAPTAGGDPQFHQRDEHNRYERLHGTFDRDNSDDSDDRPTPGGDPQFHQNDEHNRYERRN